jgi:hypothetical protein
MPISISTIQPYNQVSGGAVGYDSTTSLSALYIQAVLNNFEGRVNRPITQSVGRWDINFRLDNSGSNFFEYIFLSSSSNSPVSGYALRAIVGSPNTAALISIDGSYNETVLLTTTLSNPNAAHTMSVSRDVDGNFQFWLDGVSVGTVQDTTYTSFTYDWMRLWSGSGTSTAYIFSLKFNGVYVNDWDGVELLPYVGVWGNYGVSVDPVTSEDVLWLGAVQSSSQGYLSRAITEFTGEWTVNFRMDSSFNNSFYYEFLAGTSGVGQSIDSSYAIRANVGGDGLAALVKTDSAGTETTLLSTLFSNPNAIHMMSVSRDVDGNFQFWLDGVSVGTVQDTTYTSFTYDWLREWSISGGGSPNVYINGVQKDGINIIGSIPTNCDFNVSNQSNVSCEFQAQTNIHANIFNYSAIDWYPLIHLNILKQSGNPIVSCTTVPGNNVEGNIGCPRLININGQLRMYLLEGYVSGVCEIGYVVGDSTLQNWENDSGPLYNFTSGSVGERIGNIIKIGDLYYMYQGTEPATNIYVSTSPNGINWTPISSPVLSADSGIGEPCINLPYVIEFNGTYYMYYTNYNGSYLHPYQHKVATSPDGLNWTKVGFVNQIGGSEDWDSTFIEDKSVYYDGNNYLLVYEGYNGTQWCVGLSISSSPTGPFTKSSINPILRPSGVPGTFDQYHVATPLLYESGGTLYLFYQGCNYPTYNSNSAVWDIGLAIVKSLSPVEMTLGFDIENESDVSCEFTSQNLYPVIGGSLLNQSGITGEFYTKAFIKGDISNDSVLSYQMVSGIVHIKALIANTSILQSRFTQNYNFNLIISNVGAMYPLLLGDMVYFCGEVYNVSNFNPILPSTTYYLIENVSGTEISGLTFEPAYQGSNSAVQTIILQSIEGSPDLTVNISASSGLVPTELQNASENSYEYVNLSSTGDTGDWHDTLEVTIPSGGSVKFYIQADIPANAVAGGWMCSLNTTATVNSGTYSQNLILGGTTLTGNPVIATGGTPNVPVIAEMGNVNYNAITKFTITDKINVAAKTFEIDYSTALTPEEFESGTQVILAQEDTTMLNGSIQDAEEDANPGNHSFVLTGRDQAQALVNQSFTAAINCPVAPSASGGAVLVGFYTYPQLLNMILAGTPIQIGSSVNISDQWNSSLSFCGTWSTKKIALDYLFYLIAQNTGQELEWFIDNDGFLQTFDVSNPGAVALYLHMDDPAIRTLKFVDNSENVVNRITAYGSTNNSISVTVNDLASQAIYGIIEGPDLQDCSLTTETEVQAAAEAQLALNCNPVYTATIVLPQFPGAVAGQPVMFPGHPKYGNTVFIISEVLRTGVQANYTTTITATTDPNVISPMESFDMVQIVAQNAVAQNLPQVGVVSAVGDGVATVNTVGGVVSANTLDQTVSDSDSSSSSSSSSGSGGSSLNVLD